MLYGVIIPTYNEKDNVQILCELIKKSFEKINGDFLIIFVDDNSPDGTANVIRDLKSKYPIDLIQRGGKQGIGSAYKLVVEKKPELDFIIIMDADLSQNPLDIVRFVEKQKETNSDIVYGTRYNGGTTVNWGFKRRFISRYANNLTQVLLGADITDFTNSFRLYRGSLLRALLPSIKSDGFSFQMETIFLASSEGFKISEVPIIFYERASGVSKLGGKEIFLFLKELFSLFLRS